LYSHHQDAPQHKERKPAHLVFEWRDTYRMRSMFAEPGSKHLSASSGAIYNR